MDEPAKRPFGFCLRLSLWSQSTVIAPTAYDNIATSLEFSLDAQLTLRGTVNSHWRARCECPLRVETGQSAVGGFLLVRLLTAIIKSGHSRCGTVWAATDAAARMVTVGLSGVCRVAENERMSTSVTGHGHKTHDPSYQCWMLRVIRGRDSRGCWIPGD
jgi:hypothetical protein